MWADKEYLDILGSRFVVQSTDPAYSDLVRTVLKPFLFDRPTGVPAKRRYGLVGTDEGQVLAYRDCRRLGAPTDLGSAIVRLVAALNRSAIEECEQFAVHAGVVALGDKAVAFPVDSGGGKSTLTAACLLAGLDYVSDEALCVDIASGQVLPYPKPIALNAKSLDLLGLKSDEMTVPLSGPEALVAPEDVPATISSDPLSLRHLVLASYGHEDMGLDEIAGSEAMAALLRLSFNHYKFGETAFRLAAELASEVTAWRLTYGDPLVAAKLVRTRLG